MDRPCDAAVGEAGGLDDVAAVARRRPAARHGLPRRVWARSCGRPCRGTTPSLRPWAADDLIAGSSASGWAYRPGPWCTTVETGRRAWVAGGRLSVPVASLHPLIELRRLAEHEPDARRSARLAVCLPHDWLTWPGLRRRGRSAHS